MALLSSFVGLLSNASILTNGLVLALEAGNTLSYPGTGTTWSDVSGNGNNFILNNASAFNSSGPKYMNFNGSFGASYSNSTNITISSTPTYMVWTRLNTSTADWRTLTRAEAGTQIHHVIVGTGGNNLGAYNGSFIDTGYSVTSIPGYGTSTWVCLYFRWNTSSPFYRMSYNDTPGTIRASSTNSLSAYGATTFGSLGAYNARAGIPSQFWGDVSAFYAYNRILTDDELIQNFNATKSLYGL